MKHEHGTAFLRVYEGLKLLGKSAGERVSEREIQTLLAPYGVGRRSIRQALTMTLERKNRRGYVMTVPQKMPKILTNTCVFVPTTKRVKSLRHRSPQQYIIPTIGRLLELFNVKGEGADPITLDDIWSFKTYRSALNRELIRRRAGKYSQGWLAKRLSVCVRTLQRYVCPTLPTIARKLLRRGIPVQWMRRGWNLYWVGEKISQSHIFFVQAIEYIFDN